MSTVFLSAAEAATELGALARRFAVAFEQFARDSTDPQRPPAERVWLATVSRRCGQHAQALADLVPESVLLADARSASDALPAELPADHGQALGELIRQLTVLIERADSVANGPLLRTATAVARDLQATDR